MNGLLHFYKSMHWTQNGLQKCKRVWPDHWDEKSPKIFPKNRQFFHQIGFLDFLNAKVLQNFHQHLFNLRNGILIAFSKLICIPLIGISTLKVCYDVIMAFWDFWRIKYKIASSNYDGQYQALKAHSHYCVFRMRLRQTVALLRRDRKIPISALTQSTAESADRCGECESALKTGGNTDPIGTRYATFSVIIET